jgi:Pretoxin HINT domain
MAHWWDNKTKKLVIAGVAALSATVLLFQNCAKSIDLNQYQNGSAATSTASCMVPSTLTWTVDASTCSAATTGVPLAANGNVGYNATAPSTGAASFTCTNGTLTVDTGATCDLSCDAPATFSWNVGAATCTAAGGIVMANGAAQTIAATSPNTGGATFTCTSNQIVVSNATCTLPATPGCTEPNPLAWAVGGVTCTAPGGQTLGNAATVTVTSTSANKGSATFTCANQTVGAATNATCVAAVAPPAISSILPAASSGCVGDSFSLTVTATGTAPLTYQWYNTATSGTAGTAISGATTATFSRGYSVGLSYYYAVVSNAGGSVTSGQVSVDGRAFTSPLCGGGCFVEGTPVTMADGSHKPIEEIHSGDNVLAFNELTHSTYVTPVISPLHHSARTQLLHHFTLADGRTFTSNDAHPIYVVEKNKWMKARDIFTLFKSGATVSLQSQGGQAVGVTNITLEEKYTAVYNLEVEGLAPYSARTGQFGAGHSYYVNGILVHNIKE